MLRSCPTAVELYKNVAERGKWGELMMEVGDQVVLEGGGAIKIKERK